MAKRAYELRDCQCDPFHCMCSELLSLEQRIAKHWWSAWLSTWTAIALCKELGEQCSYQYARAFAQNKLNSKGFMK